MIVQVDYYYYQKQENLQILLNLYDYIDIVEFVVVVIVYYVIVVLLSDIDIKVSFY